MEFSLFGQQFSLFPIMLSLKVAGLSTLASLVLGTLTARILARRRSVCAAVIDSLCTLPMVLPPTVLGYYLILLLGRNGVFGPVLQELGLQFMFSWQGAVVAAISSAAGQSMEDIKDSLGKVWESRKLA